MDSGGLTFVIFILFLFAIFLLPWNSDYEMFSLGSWKNNIHNQKALNGYCAPDFSKFNQKDNVAVRCVGNGNMTYGDCCKLRDIGQICGVNRDTWETYPCKYYSGKACSRCETQNFEF